MSNSYTTPPLLPDSNSVVAGQTIASTTLSRFGDLSNYIDGNGCTSNVISQSYDDDVFTMDSSSTPSTPSSSWRFPTISSKHLSLVVYVVAKTTGNPSTVGLELLVDSATISGSITVSAGSYTTYSTTLTASSITVTYAQLDLKLTAGSTGSTQIRTVMARWSPLSSPLSAGASTLGSSYNCVPFGVSRLGANQALTSRAGHQMFDNIEHFRQRPRVLISWSGIFNTSPITSSTSPPRTLGAGDVDVMKPLAPYFSSTHPSDHKFTVAVKFNGTATPVGMTIMGNEINTTGNVGWENHTFTVLTEIDSRSLEFNQDLLKWGLDTVQSNSTALARTANGFVESFSLWSC